MKAKRHCLGGSAIIKLEEVLVVATAALVALGGSWARCAGAQAFDPEFQVNEFTPNGQYDSALAADAAGGFVVAWESYYQDGSYGGVFGRRLDSNGLPVGSEFQVNGDAAGSQYAPAVAANAAGGFVVVWSTWDLDGSYTDVFGRRFGPDGSPIGGEFEVNSHTTGYQSSPAVAVGGSDAFVVVWQSSDQDGSGDGVFGRLFDSNGVPSSDEILLNTTRTGSQSRPSIAASGAGRFLVVWQGDDGDGLGILGRRLDSAGLPTGGEFQVNLSTSGDQFEPVLAAVDANSWVVIWTSLGQDGSGTGVFGRKVGSIGMPLGPEFAVNSVTTDSQDEPSVVATGGGAFVVIWESYAQDGSAYGVVGRRFDAAGIPMGAEFVVNAHTDGGQYQPAVAANGAGSFLVAWDSYGQDGSYSGIFARHGTMPLFADGFDSGSACAWSAALGGGCL